MSLLRQLLCRNRHQRIYLVKFKQSGTQEIRLRPSQQYWECQDCGKFLGKVGIYDVTAPAVRNIKIVTAK